MKISKLVYPHSAGKDANKLDKQVKKRIGNILTKYKEAPFRYVEKLTNDLFP